MDQDAYDHFRGGLTVDREHLEQQLFFVATDFGGAPRDALMPVQEKWLATRIIAGNILDAAHGYHDLVARQETLEAAPLDPLVVTDILSPFIGLPREGLSYFNFPVWASKVLHFSRLDTFPVLDSMAKLALGLSRGVGYPRFVGVYRPVFVDGLDTLRALRAEENYSRAELRRLDKLLYQVGKEMG